MNGARSNSILDSKIMRKPVGGWFRNTDLEAGSEPYRDLRLPLEHFRAGHEFMEVFVFKRS